MDPSPLLRSPAGPAEATSRATSWVLDRAPVLRSRFSTCFSTVRGDRYSRIAISLFARPSATSLSTSASRAVTPRLAQDGGTTPPRRSSQRRASRWIPWAANALVVAQQRQHRPARAPDERLVHPV